MYVVKKCSYLSNAAAFLCLSVSEVWLVLLSCVIGSFRYSLTLISIIWFRNKWRCGGRSWSTLWHAQGLCSTVYLPKLTSSVVSTAKNSNCHQLHHASSVFAARQMHVYFNIHDTVCGTIGLFDLLKSLLPTVINYCIWHSPHWLTWKCYYFSLINVCNRRRARGK